MELNTPLTEKEAKDLIMLTRETSTLMKKALVYTQDSSLLSEVSGFLGPRTWELESTDTLPSLGEFRRSKPALIILDTHRHENIREEYGSLLSVKNHSETWCLLLAEQSLSAQELRSLHQRGIDAYLPKPWTQVQLRAHLARAQHGHIKGWLSDADSPDSLGPYSLDEVLGSGGMGVVYRATHSLTGEQVALKHLPVGAEIDQAYLFQAEVDFLRRQSHPGIVSLYDHGREDKGRYYTMEIVDGGTVEDLVSMGPRPLTEILDLVLTLAKTLSYIHKRGFVHLDIKPSNILLRDRHSPVLADFGFVRKRFDRAVTRPDIVIGTPHYMSPEVSMGSKVDGRSDLFSLGIVILELLMGHSPTDTNDPDEAREMLRTGDFKKASDLPKLDPYLAAVIDQLVDIDPNYHYQRADDFIRALEQHPKESVTGHNRKRSRASFNRERARYEALH